ncbi:MAG: hypothetical protein AB7O88_22870 [Reyranellaceae bacterium]|jgi:hypothetical protein
MIRILAILLALAPFAASAAEGCLERTRALASRYALSIDPPGPVDTGRPGAIVEPPKTHDPAVVQPGESQGSAMPTLPDVTPGKPRHDASTPLSPADRAALQATLIAARDHALAGREEACSERLAKALQFIGRTRN